MSMLLFQALLDVELVEHGSANPFVALVSAVEFRTNQLNTPIDSPIAKKAMVSQLTNLIQILDSVKDWTVPEKDIRKNLDIAIPAVKINIISAIAAIEKGDLTTAVSELKLSKKELIKHSHLEFN